MADLNQTRVTAQGEYQAHFGGVPGAADTPAECKRWETLCGELLLERQRLREELAKMTVERDTYLRSLYACLRQGYEAPTFTREEVMEAAAHGPTFGELIRELDRTYAQEQ